jgi:hypothetical protein
LFDVYLNSSNFTEEFNNNEFDYSSQEVLNNSDDKGNKELVRVDFANKMKLQGGLSTKSLNLSSAEQLESIYYEYEAYKNQIQKFSDINIRIIEGKEEFFPDESMKLFIEYIETIKHLLEELSSRQLNIISTIPLPEQTEEEINSLLSNDILESTYSETIPLPEQTEEEINSLLEPEDFMFDAVNSLNMFSED